MTGAQITAVPRPAITATVQLECPAKCISSTNTGAITTPTIGATLPGLRLFFA